MKSAVEKWHLAKKFGLCCRCLGDAHLGNACRRSKSCSIGGCKENHHYLLHKEKSSLPKTKDDKRRKRARKKIRTLGVVVIRRGIDNRSPTERHRGKKQRLLR